MSLTKIIQVDPLTFQEGPILEAAKVIVSGGLVIIPTETVYGVAASSLNKKAQEKLYKIKNRPKDKPFSILIAQPHRVHEYARNIPVAAYKLMQKFWPGPLTLILQSLDKRSVGLRVPKDLIALSLIIQSGVPLACPSANISDQPPPVNFQEAIKDLDGKVDLGIDAGPTSLGKESTVVDCTVVPPVIVRKGAISDEEILEVIKVRNILFICTGNSCRSVMAEAYLKHILAKQGRTDIHVSSAGIMALGGMGASEGTREILANEGIDVSGHRAQRVTRDLINQSDLILVMDTVHEDNILQMAPEAKNRLFLLKEFAKINDTNLNIADPAGGSIEFYQDIFI